MKKVSIVFKIPDKVVADIDSCMDLEGFRSRTDFFIHLFQLYKKMGEGYGKKAKKGKAKSRR